MGTRQSEQSSLWVATSELPKSPGASVLRAAECAARRPRLRSVRRRPVPAFLRAGDGPAEPGAGPVLPVAAGRLLRRASTRNAASPGARRDSLAVRSFLRLPLDEAPPDHSTISRTRRLIDLETHRAVFTWVQQRLVEAGLLKGKTVAIDATTLEANAAMRSIVRRDTGGELSGVSDAAREGLGHRDADARGPGAAGPQAQEEDVEQRLDESARSRCEGHEDERWPDASGPQSGACGRPGDRRHCRGHAAGRRRKATRRRSSRRRLPRPSRSKTRRPTSRSRSRWKRSSPTRGITAIRRWSTSTPWASGPTWRSRTAGDAIGRRSPRPRRRCMAIVAGFVDGADGV